MSWVLDGDDPKWKVQGTLKSLLQHNNSKASILWCSAFFIVQLSHPYMSTGKTIALSSWTEEPGRLQSMGSLRVRHDWVTSLSLFTFMHWEGNGNPLQCYCLENPRDGGAWWAAVYGVTQSLTRLKWLSSSSSSMAESEEELKSLLMKVKEESEKAGLKLNIQNSKIMALVPSLHGI